MLTTILCATDGSEHADRALRYAGQLAEHEHARLHVVHIIERVTGGGRLFGENVFINEAEIGERIKAQTAAISSQHDVQATLHITKGTTTHVAQRLAETADRLDADLMVIGPRGHTALGGLIRGSVTQRLLHATTRPVLALPPTHADATAATERLTTAA